MRKEWGCLSIIFLDENYDSQDSDGGSVFLC